MLDICFDIIELCADFLISWNGSLVIMAVLIIITAFDILRRFIK